MDRTDEERYRNFLHTGDTEELEILVDRYKEGLTLFLYGFVGTMEDAEDLMIDTFAAAVSESAGFRGESSFKTWLFGIGRNLALMQMRRRRFLQVPLGRCMESHQDPPDLQVMREEQNRQLYQAMENLHPDYRQALHLLYFEQMSHEQIAAVMKKNIRQVYKLVSRGREALKRQLPPPD